MSKFEKPKSDGVENVANSEARNSVEINKEKGWDSKVKFFEAPLKPAYSLNELLTLVPIGRSSVYNEIKAGRLRASKMGRRTLILANDVSSWLERMRSC